MKLLKFFMSFVFLFLLSFIVSCNIEPYEDDVQEVEDKPKTCEEAIQNSTTAGANLISATELNYSEICSTYKLALQNQIELCGDETGLLKLVLDSLGDCEGSIVAPPTNDQGFMTANINGEQFNDMKPNSYLFFPGGVSVNDFFTRSDDDYLTMQGNSGYKNPMTIEVTDKEINLKLPSALWKEETFVLYNDDNDIYEGVCYYTFFSYGRPNNIEKVDLPGEIVISKFNLIDKVIQGTFEFEYKLVNTDDDSEEGPFKVTGTFDYALDDEFFD